MGLRLSRTRPPARETRPDRPVSQTTAPRDHPLPDGLVRFGTNLPFRDASGLAKFPVDGPQLPQSRVVIRVYEPESHFTRALVIPQLKLKDWETQ